MTSIRYARAILTGFALGVMWASAERYLRNAEERHAAAIYQKVMSNGNGG